MNSPSIIWRQHKLLPNYLGKKGKILVWTKISVPPKGFEHQVPYFVGIVKFDDGEKLPIQIVDCEEKNIRISLRVEAVIRKVGKGKPEDVIEYGVKVKPI